MSESVCVSECVCVSESVCVSECVCVSESECVCVCVCSWSIKVKLDGDIGPSVVVGNHGPA